MTAPTCILDTSPLITLAGPPLQGQPIIDWLLPLIDLVVVETVALEATVNLTYADGQRIQALLDAGQIRREPVPPTPVDDLIQAYPRLGLNKGKGERDTIRLGIMRPEAQVVIDDQQAFFVAARFELCPLTLLDLLVNLVRSEALDKSLAVEMTLAMAGRYAPISIQHTLYKFREAGK